MLHIDTYSAILLFYYPQDTNYSILHIMLHFNTLINKNTPQSKTFNLLPDLF